jgi:hypothetical protein
VSNPPTSRSAAVRISTVGIAIAFAVAISGNSDGAGSSRGSSPIAGSTTPRSSPSPRSSSQPPNASPASAAASISALRARFPGSISSSHAQGTKNSPAARSRPRFMLSGNRSPGGFRVSRTRGSSR